MGSSIETLSYISDQLNRYLSPIIFLFGVIGNSLNCLVLSQRALRSNSCALLFLASSLADLISIVVGLTTRIMAGWHYDPTVTIDSICKLRAFIVFSTRTMATWLITLATADRWLLSSVSIRRRHLATLKNVKRSIVVCVVLSIFAYVHMLWCYEANLHDQPLHCYGKTEACRLATDLVYALISTVFPLILMVVFGVLTISNAHHVRMRVRNMGQDSSGSNQTDQKSVHARKTDRNMVRMLFVQVLLLVVLCTPQAIQKIHITFRPFRSGTPMEDAVKSFLYNIDILLAFIASGMPFYIYTLAGGTIFREAFTNLMQTLFRKMRNMFQVA